MARPSSLRSRERAASSEEHAEALDQPRDERGGHRVQAEAVAQPLLLLLRQQADDRVEKEPPAAGPCRATRARSRSASAARTKAGPYTTRSRTTSPSGHARRR